MRYVFAMLLLFLSLTAFCGVNGLLPTGDGSYYPQSEYHSSMSTENDISKFALSFNPLGFIQFGPFIGAEFRLKENVVLNLHTRISNLGLLSYVVRGENLDKLSGVSFGAGPIIFLTENQSKPYIGLLMEYDWAKSLYHSGSYNENTHFENNIAFLANGGYRFRFPSGFFVNTGLFLGAAWTTWTEEYTDSSIEGEDGRGIRPFGMFEVTLGIEL